MTNIDDATVHAEATSSVSRDEIVSRFERWLDRTLSAEEPPEGIDAELLAALTGDNADPHDEPDAHTDSYALWSAVTTLTQEVKLQGRAFKDLHGALGTESKRAAEEVRAAYSEREREIQREAERRCRKEIVSALIDLRDSLGRGLESVCDVEADIQKRPPRNWLTRIVKPSGEKVTLETLSALTKGYELGLERLDQVLEDFNVHEIACERQPFDPRRMNAIDRGPSDDVPEGTVLEVYRSGYEWNGQVFRAAHVKVSCAPPPHSAPGAQHPVAEDYE
jgi:molecular chaperone GrpE